MTNLFKRLFSILSLNTLVALFFAVSSTAISIQQAWHIDFPLTIIGIAVVFPIVFSIGGAYNRREAALVQYGIMKSSGRTIFLAARDWLRDDDSRKTSNVRFFILVLFFTALSAHSQEDIENSENIFSSSFSEIRKHHYVDSQYAFFTVTNRGKRDIDDVVLSLALVDANNEALSRNAVTDITPGMTWLKSDESIELGVPVDDHPDAQTLLTKSPGDAKLKIEIRKITFME